MRESRGIETRFLLIRSSGEGLPYDISVRTQGLDESFLNETQRGETFIPERRVKKQFIITGS